jgi:hypothetical protein
MVFKSDWYVDGVIELDRGQINVYASNEPHFGTRCRLSRWCTCAVTRAVAGPWVEQGQTQEPTSLPACLNNAPTQAL